VEADLVRASMSDPAIFWLTAAVLAAAYLSGALVGGWSEWIRLTR
jgi:hypothetical protein